MLNCKTMMSGAAAIALAVVWGAGAAQAATVQLEQTVPDTSTILNVFGENDADRLYDNVRISVQGTNQHVYAGAFQVTETGTTNNWLAFCVDLFTSYSMPAAFETNADLFGAATVTRLDKLFTNFFEDVTTDTKAAGFQVAIWEIVSDATLDLMNGDFILRDHAGNVDVRTQSTTYLSGLDALSGGGYDLTFFENAQVQNLVVATPPAVPLPASALLLVAGLGALGAAGRRKG